jgi:hypothetical protein
VRCAGGWAGTGAGPGPPRQRASAGGWGGALCLPHGGSPSDEGGGSCPAYDKALIGGRNPQIKGELAPPHTRGLRLEVEAARREGGRAAKGGAPRTPEVGAPCSHMRAGQGRAGRGRVRHERGRRRPCRAEAGLVAQPGPGAPARVRLVRGGGGDVTLASGRPRPTTRGCPSPGPAGGALGSRSQGRGARARQGEPRCLVLPERWQRDLRGLRL